MSGEYYCIEEVINPKIYYDHEYERARKSERVAYHKEQDRHSNASKQSQDFRLHEIEEQLEIAETKCNTLKGQLDSMKKIYQSSQVKTEHSPTRPLHNRFETSSYMQKRTAMASSGVQTTKNPRKRSATPVYGKNKSRSCTPRKRDSRDLQDSSDTVPQKSSSSSTGFRRERPARPPRPAAHRNGHFTALIRQNSSSIGTDHTGAAVRTINNILTGITDSVNRLSHLPDAEVKRHKNVSVGQKIPEVEDEAEQAEVDAANYPVCKVVVENAKPRAWARFTNKISATSRTAKGQCSSGSLTVPKSVRATPKSTESPARPRPTRASTVDDDNQSITPSRKRKRNVKRLKIGSRSSLGKKCSDQNTATAKRFDQFTTDNLVELYHNVAAKGSDSDEMGVKQQRGAGDLPAIQEDAQARPAGKAAVQQPQQPQAAAARNALAPISEGVFVEKEFAAMKSYELPTIASRMKQVPKCYLQSFNFRSIPFCAAKSTSPSHNIGLNIQQVMSIIKTRQPIAGISPTLAHNISLAAGKLQSRPLSTLMSTLSSKIGYGRSQCPLLKSSLDYARLQEIARELQEQTYDEARGYGDEEEAEGAFVNGASGDQEKSWMMDAEMQKRCTCSPPKVVPLQQVLNKFQMSPEGVYPGITKSRHFRSDAYYNRRLKGNLSINLRKQRTRSWLKNEVPPGRNAANVERSQSELKGKEKNLKIVLQNLHDDFERLNTKYENLAEEVKSNAQGPNEANVRKLEEIEGELNKKEEEIKMVMALYTEVVALKDQVKKLRTRASQASVSVAPNNHAEYKEPKTAMHLNKLLRQIQNYQLHCENNSNSKCVTS